MSDDFDKDDLSWLRGTDDQSDDEQTDDETFDWQQDTPGQPQSPSSGGLGFTGELPWLGDDQPTDVPGAPGSGLTGELPWLAGEQTDEPGYTGTGLTGELPWLGDTPSADAPQGSGLTGELSWLGGTDDESDATPGTPPQFLNAEPAPPASSDNLPDWLRGTGQDEGDFAKPDEPTTVVTPPSSTSINVPDWLMEADAPAAAAADVPEWLLESAPQSPTQSASDVPDWLLDESVEAPSTDVPDWLMEAAPQPPQPQSSPPAAALGDDFTFDDDFFASLEAEAAQAASTPQSTLTDDFLSTLDQPAPDDEMPDWLSMAEETTPLAEQPATTTATDETSFDFGEFDMPSEEDLLPDWLATEQDTAQPLGDDFLSGLGLAAPEFGDAPQYGSELDPEFLRAVESQEEVSDADLLRALDIDPAKKDTGQLVEDYIASLDTSSTEAAPVDWFADQAESADSLDWLQDIDNLETPVAAQAQAAPDAGAEDFLAAFGDDFDFEAEAEPLSDIDSILASLDDSGAVLPDTGELIDQPLDMDALFADPAFSEIEQPKPQGGLPADMPDFLTELGASVSAVSAAAMLRQRQDRPLDELSDRLQKLRDQGEALPAAPAASLETVLPGVTGGLAPSVVEVEAPGLGGAMVITPDQQRKVDLLKSLAVIGSPTSAPGAPSAIDLTYDTPFLTDEDDIPEPDIEGEAAQAAAPIAVRQPRVRPRADRVVIALVLAAAVIAPFYLRQLRIGSLPPAQFAAASRQQDVFDTVQSLGAGDFVLVAAEYGATGAAELDSSANVLLRHILARGAHPVVLSTNPVNVLRIGNLFTQIDPGLQPNDDYTVVRYLSGEAVGVRALAGNMAALLTSDVRGQATNLNLNALSDFTAVVVIAERPDDLRVWAEQVSPLTTIPVLGAIGAAAEPLSEPYLGTGIDGLLVGYRDAYTYGAMLGAPVLSTEEPAAETEEAQEATVEPRPERTREVLATVLPPTEATIRSGIITAASDVNVREQPASDATIISQLAPDASVIVLDQSDDNLWVKVLLEDGREGWVSAILIRIISTPQVASTATSGSQLQPPSATVASATPQPSATPRATSTDVPSATATERPSSTPTPRPSSTLVPTATQTSRPSATPAPSVTPVPTRIIARVIAAERVNVRSGPGTDNQPIAAVNPGTELEVIGRNGDGSWIQVVLEDGREGWISAGLLELSAEEIEESSELIVVMADGDFSLSSLLAQPVTDEPTVEASTDEPATSTAAPTNQPTLQPTPQATRTANIPYAEERWYAMNLGLVASIVIILLGAVINIARALLRRGRS
jgi:uncharacterized protein YgiM (DUF1202 family)